ncbi:MAG: hypothetical protein ABR575_09195 [Actinomycetota bacterium]
MKKAVLVALVMGLLVGSYGAPVEAKKKKKPKRVERTIEHEYGRPSPGVPGVVGTCLAAFDPEGGCVNIPLGPGEKFAEVAVEDATGQDVYFILGQDTNVDQPGFEIFYNGCGASDGPVAITKGLELRASVYAFGGAGCPGVASSGTITVKLSNLP